MNETWAHNEWIDQNGKKYKLIADIINRTVLKVKAAHDLVAQMRGLALQFDQQRLVIARRLGRICAAVYLGVLSDAAMMIEVKRETVRE